MQEMLEKSGGVKSTPTVLIGDVVIVGFKPDKFTVALNL